MATRPHKWSALPIAAGFHMSPASSGNATISDAIFASGWVSNLVVQFRGNGNGTFDANTPSVTFAASQPYGILSADVNGDGNVDLVYTGYTASNITILLGNSNGTFQALATYGTASKPFALALADVNGDGKLDILTGNYNNTNGLTTLLGNGNGTFQAPLNYAGTWSIGMAVGVTTTSGNLDVVLTNNLNDTVSLYLGNGNGTFGARTTRAVGGHPQVPRLGKLTSSGNLDLVVACAVSAGNSVINVLLGNGNGTFGANTSFHTGTYPDDLALVDLDGDGKLDIAVTAQVDQNAIVFLGNGNGTFQAGQTFTNVGSKPWSLQVADLNGDGNLDLAIGNDQDGMLSTLLGNGNGTFKASQTFATGNSVKNFRGLAVSGTAFKVTAPATVTSATSFAFTVTAQQFNSVTATNYKGTVHFTSSDGSGTLPANATLTSGVGTFTATLASVGSQTITASDTQNVSLIGHSGAITVGNALDIIVNNRTDNTVGVLLGNGNGTFGAMVTYAQPTTQVTSFAAVDLDGDGHLDLATATTGTAGNRNVASLLGNGNGTFAAETAFGQSVAITWMAAAALHGGTTQDVAFCLNGSAVVLLGNGNGTFGAGTTFTGNGGNRITISDVNNDGIQDLICTASAQIGCLLGNGNGTFQAIVNTSITSTGAFTAVADVNNDGKQDLVTTSSGGGGIVCVNIGNGNGTFQAGTATTYAVGAAPKGLVCTDLNGDGVNDLAVCNYTNSTVSVLLGNNNGTFQAQTTFATAGTAYGIAAADINGDGKIDLVVTDQSTNQVSVLLGNGNGTFRAKTDLTVGTSPRQIVLARTTQ